MDRGFGTSHASRARSEAGAAGGVYRLPGDPVSTIAGEETDHIRNILRSTNSVERGNLHGAVAGSGCVDPIGIGVGANGARRDRVHRDPAFGQLGLDRVHDITRTSDPTPFEIYRFIYVHPLTGLAGCSASQSRGHRATRGSSAV